MISIILLLFATIAYFSDNPEISFWIIIFCIINGMGALVRAFLFPEWYLHKTLRAGIEPSYKMLVISKTFIISILLWGAWQTGKASGYL